MTETYRIHEEKTQVTEIGDTTLFMISISQPEDHIIAKYVDGKHIGMETHRDKHKAQAIYNRLIEDAKAGRA